MLRRIAPCFFAIIIDALGFGLVYPVLAVLFTTVNSPILSTEVSLATRHFYLGIGYLLYPLCMFFGASFMGDLSDQWGRKKVLLLCMLGITVSFGLMAVGVEWSSLSLLFLGRALSGLMAGSQPIAQASIADLSTLQTKAFNMSLISLSYSFGAVIGPLIGGVMSDKALLSWFNFSTPFMVAAILSALAYVWLYFGFEETAFAISERKISLLQPIRIFIEAFQHVTVRHLVIVFLLMQIGFSVYFQFIIIDIKTTYHYSNWQLGVFQGMLGVGFAVGLLVGMPYLIKRYSIKTIAINTLIFTGIGQLLAAINSLAWLQWFLVILIGMFDIMAFASMLTLFSNAVDEKSQGWVMGISSAVMALAWVLTGLSSNLMSLLNTASLIAIGGLFLIA